LAHLLTGSGLQVKVGRKVNPFGYWTIVQCVNTKEASGRQRGGLRRNAPLAVSS
jgi:hypothetical protein